MVYNESPRVHARTTPSDLFLLYTRVTDEAGGGRKKKSRSQITRSTYKITLYKNDKMRFFLSIKNYRVRCVYNNV